MNDNYLRENRPCVFGHDQGLKEKARQALLQGEPLLKSGDRRLRRKPKLH